MNAKDILAKYFGYTNFRLKQEEIINEVIAKKDVLALLPTGGGKSICYQVPALMQEGICIVISPLIALMHDQILFLQSKGIKSISISGNMNYNQIENALTNCIYGGVKFLYLSPERLQSKLVQSKLEMMNVNLIAIDEVHCISEWGHDFRPSYRHINIVRSICKAVPILALTATATLDVINDIKENLTFKNYRIIKSSFQRKNLSYIIDQTQNKTDKLLQLVEKIKSSVIVYVSKRKDTKDIAYLLSKHNYPASFYHAGLPLNLRKNSIIIGSNNIPHSNLRLLAKAAQARQPPKNNVKVSPGNIRAGYLLKYRNGIKAPINGARIYKPCTSFLCIQIIDIHNEIINPKPADKPLKPSNMFIEFDAHVTANGTIKIIVEPKKMVPINGTYIS